MTSDQCDGNLPSPVAGWIRNYAVNNIWRVSQFYEVDDLCQDGLLLAVSVRNRYGRPGVDIAHPHFMSLVQTAFIRHVIDMGRRQQLALAVGDAIHIADLGTSEVSVRERYSFPDTPLGVLARCVVELPVLNRVVRHSWLHPTAPLKRPRRTESDLRMFLCDC